MLEKNLCRNKFSKKLKSWKITKIARAFQEECSQLPNLDTRHHHDNKKHNPEYTIEKRLGKGKIFIFRGVFTSREFITCSPESSLCLQNSPFSVTLDGDESYLLLLPYYNFNPVVMLLTSSFQYLLHEFHPDTMLDKDSSHKIVFFRKKSSSIFQKLTLPCIVVA